MATFKPIPKRLLIHDVTYYPPKTEDDGSMGSGTENQETEIKHVRFEPKRKKLVRPDNSETITNGILFVDYVNSEPFIELHEAGQIEFRGRKLSIVHVNELYTTNQTPHHLEVMLQ